MRYGRMEENNVLRLMAKNVIAAYVTYIERVNDFKNKLSPAITIFGKGGTNK